MEMPKESLSLDSMSPEDMKETVESLCIGLLTKEKMNDRVNFNNVELAEVLDEALNVCRNIFSVYPINSKTTKDEIDCLQEPIENYLRLVTQQGCARGGQRILALLEALTGVNLYLTERWAEEMRRRTGIANISRDKVDTL